MLACESGHTEVARLLEAAGSDVEMRNSAGRTGHELAAIASQQEEQAKLTPFRHGRGLYLGCDSLESYLDLREKMLDEDVAAGIRLWHTKQAVYHFDREAMKQLEATVKDLQAKSFDVAVSLRPARLHQLVSASSANSLCPQLHFTDFGSCSLVLHSKGIRASAVGQLGG